MHELFRLKHKTQINLLKNPEKINKIFRTTLLTLMHQISKKKNNSKDTGSQNPATQEHGHYSTVIDGFNNFVYASRENK